MLRKSVRAFVEKEVTPHVDEWETAGRIPKSFWQRLGEVGFLGLEFPVEYGGAGGDFLSSVVLGEEMARCRSGGVAFSVLVHTDMSSPWLTRYGNDAQKRKYLPGIISGETVCALGITEPGTGSDMANLSCRAVRKGHQYLLTGSKTFITNGVYGDLYFVAARTAPGTAERRHDGLSMFLVERGLPGFTVSRKLDKMGMLASDTAGLAFHDCPVPAENLLGVEGRGFQQRHAFGGPLSDKQSLRHRMAEMATEIEAARHLVYHAAGLYNAGRASITEVSMAKLFCTEVANRVAYQAVQLHGGYGYMREFSVERFFRDVRLWTIASGTSEMMKEIIAKRLL